MADFASWEGRGAQKSSTGGMFASLKRGFICLARDVSKSPKGLASVRKIFFFEGFSSELENLHGGGASRSGYCF